MNAISENFYRKLYTDKMVGRDAANEFIATHGLDAAKHRASTENLSNEEARKEYGYWCGWVEACLWPRIACPRGNHFPQGKFRDFSRSKTCHKS